MRRRGLGGGLRRGLLGMDEVTGFRMALKGELETGK